MVNDMIGDIIALKKMPQPHLARSLLSRTATRVAHIMQSRNYRVKQLTEFYPTQQNLLGINVNRGAKISLRLRSPHNEHEFLDEQDILGTMLHELCHCIHGPHDAKFYALLDELSLECTQGPKKTPFAGPGTQLGGANLSTTTGQINRGPGIGDKGKSGKVLGGQVIGSAKDLQRRVAEAAQRRAHDAIWCGAGREDDPICLEDDLAAAAEVAQQERQALIDLDDNTSVQADTTDLKRATSVVDVNDVDSDDGAKSLAKEAKETDDAKSSDVQVLEVIEIESGDEQDKHKVTMQSKKRSLSNERERRDYETMKKRGLLRDSLHEHLQKSQHVPVKKKVTIHEINGTWECPICTLRNTISSERCTACQLDRPAVPMSRDDYWQCHNCQIFNIKSLWMCSKCQCIKRSS